MVCRNKNDSPLKKSIETPKIEKRPPRFLLLEPSIFSAQLDVVIYFRLPSSAVEHEATVPYAEQDAGCTILLLPRAVLS